MLAPAVSVSFHSYRLRRLRYSLVYRTILRFYRATLCKRGISCHRVSVCLSVCPSVCHKSELYKDG